MVQRNYRLIVKPLFLFFDIFGIFFSFSGSFFIRFHFFKDEHQALLIFYKEYLPILIISLLTWTLLSYTLNLQHVPRRHRRAVFLDKNQFLNYYCYPQIIHLLFFLLIIVFSNYDNISRFFVVVFFLNQFLLLLILRIMRNKIVRLYRKTGYNLVRLSILGEESLMIEAIKWISKNKDSGFYCDNNLKLMYSNFNSQIEYAKHIIEKLIPGDYFLIDPSFLSISKKEAIYIENMVEDKGAYIFYIINLNSFRALKESTNTVGPFNVVAFRSMSIKKHINQINKRIFDVFFSFLFVVFIYWWVFIIVAVVIKISSSGPIIFSQERVGKKGKIFRCYKFRSMHIEQGEKQNKLVTDKYDLRIFKFGQFIRRTNIDEFPQFINVLMGNMSIVGPRPHMISEDSRLAEKIGKYRLRYWVRPGITGYAAISGFRGGTDNVELIQKRINLDIEYIENWSFLLDIKICLLTSIETLTFSGKGY